MESMYLSMAIWTVVQGVGAGGQLDGHGRRGLAVEAGRDPGVLGAEFDPGHVAEAHGGAVLALTLSRMSLELFGRLQAVLHR